MLRWAEEQGGFGFPAAAVESTSDAFTGFLLRQVGLLEPSALAAGPPSACNVARLPGLKKELPAGASKGRRFAPRCFTGFRREVSEPGEDQVMEDSGIPRGIWDGDAKAVQQCLTDIFTSVYTTCDIPENAIFGPCVLSHTSLYDSIAFIALKSTDKRTVPYIFRVDTSAANGSSEGLMWLRLVQSARDKEEQNLEAYIKNGQLFYRSLRRIAKDEELLVCQRFQFEFPYVAHLRFRCPKRLHSAELSPREEQGGGVGTKDHGGGGGKDQQQTQQQEAPLGPGPKFCKAGPNWCAKCNASFRMTSDLVYHMRSHHKKEYAMEPLVKRRREEKLKCPICNESFRERHHLSRHMTSHN
ncbi:PR domain zinc finger protein 8 [Camelus ferus]|nr:PR domain zinc finger protein 8 [Camelus ferus]